MTVQMALQQGLSSGLLVAQDELDVTTLGDEHRQALKDLLQALGD